MAVCHSRFKMVRLPECSDSWFKADGVHMKHEHGCRLLNQVVEAVRRSVDKGGVLSTTSSLENDMRFDKEIIK